MMTIFAMVMCATVGGLTDCQRVNYNDNEYATLAECEYALHNNVWRDPKALDELKKIGQDWFCAKKSIPAWQRAN